MITSSKGASVPSLDTSGCPSAGRSEVVTDSAPLGGTRTADRPDNLPLCGPGHGRPRFRRWSNGVGTAVRTPTRRGCLLNRDHKRRQPYGRAPTRPRRTAGGGSRHGASRERGLPRGQPSVTWMALSSGPSPPIGASAVASMSSAVRSVPESSAGSVSRSCSSWAPARCGSSAGRTSGASSGSSRASRPSSDSPSACSSEVVPKSVLAPGRLAGQRGELRVLGALAWWGSRPGRPRGGPRPPGRCRGRSGPRAASCVPPSCAGPSPGRAGRGRSADRCLTPALPVTRSAMRGVRRRTSAASGLRRSARG